MAVNAELEAPGAEIAPFFAWHRTLRAIVEAAVEGRQGTIARDDGAARISLGCYHVFGGDPASPGARRLVESADGPRELIYGNDPTWRVLILDVLGERVFDRPMDEFDPSGLDDT
ncbi:MAG TPA: hypothetical protein VN923_07405, partial [Thermoanaerobaculia bacterium]|nr:hypothetical protein [Thermoanaerobaculia bacterium]